MSIFTALFAGVNGINSNGDVVSLIGDNIANVNTVGFKSSRAEFEDILAGSSSISGLGSRIQNVSTAFGQGGFESSTSVTDLAVDGTGFFAARDIRTSETVYTRAGQFLIDKDGYVVNAQEQRLQGFGVDANGNIGTTLEDLQFTYEPVKPKATTTVTISANLYSNATVPAAFSTANPSGTSNFAAGVTVYDSIGNSHLVTVYFRRAAANSWEWYGLVDGADLTGGVAGTMQTRASGTLTFNTDGSQLNFTTAANDFDFIGAAQNQAIAMSMGTNTTGGGTGLDGVTQFGTTSNLSDVSQNGYTSGNLTTLEIASNGTITGNYTNGTTQTLGQVTLALFSNQQGLDRIGGNAYSESLSSGVALNASPQSGGRGSVLSQTLEQSNVDLASELIKMVVIQRGFQANSRTISVVNDLLGSLVNLGN